MRAVIALLPILPMLVVLGGCDRQEPEQPQAAAPIRHSGKVDITKKGQDAPAMPFLGPEGGPATLTGFRGKPLIVNLWATWCAPCVAEMPTLDALAAREKDRLALIVVSQDIEGRRAVDPFFAKAKFTMLRPYLDKENVLPLALGTDSLPITIFYDAKGKEQWRVIGSMDWAGESARTLIEQSLKPS